MFLQKKKKNYLEVIIQLVCSEIIFSKMSEM